MNEQPIIIATDVHKTYDTGKYQVNALRGIDLSIKRGEMVAVMGPSGCGKTTLLNCLSGLDDVNKGNVIIDGTEIHKLSDKKRTHYRAKNMGFVFQFFNLLPVLSAVENIELPLLVSGVPSGEARKRSLAVLERVGLTDKANARPSELSGGQQQRVTIARALVNQPAIVWGDEPTGNLDTETSQEIMDLMAQLNKQNKQTFVLVTHSMDVGKRANRIVYMRDGRVEKEELVSAMTRNQ